MKIVELIAVALRDLVGSFRKRAESSHGPIRSVHPNAPPPNSRPKPPPAPPPPTARSIQNVRIEIDYGRRPHE
jgi:hypothetical protein